jgi:hypothetical protein
MIYSFNGKNFNIVRSCLTILSIPIYNLIDDDTDVLNIKMIKGSISSA